MNPLIQGVIIALVPLGVLQTGALIYFCGVVATTLPDHHERIKRLEDNERKTAIAAREKENRQWA